MSGSDNGSDSGEESDFYDATLFPVFVTADIGLETINACLQRSASYTAAEGLDGQQALYLISSADAPHPTQPMDLPVTSFTSPFLNKSISELIDIFNDKVSQDDSNDDDLMASSVFVVLDEQSKTDGMARLVQVDDGSVDGQLRTARCDFEIAAIFALAPEEGTAELGEGEEGFGEREVVVTKARYEAIMEVDGEGDDDDGDDDDEEDDE